MRRITFRRGVPADAGALLRLAVRTYYETFAELNTPENMQAYLSTAFTLDGITADLANPAITFHVAENEGEPIGYAKLVAGAPPECVHGERAIEIERFYLDRRWHGSGVAMTLMEICIGHAQEQGFTTIYLGVWEKNFRAQAFYRKWGFDRVGEHVFHMGEDPQVDWWMSRAL